MKYFALTNLSSKETRTCDPWNTAEVGYERFQSKEEFSKFCKNPQTLHLFYSCAEGKDPGKRVSAKDNYPVKLHGAVVDIDEKFTVWEMDLICQNLTVKPARTSRTFSGKWRLLINLERPLSPKRNDWKAALRQLAKELKIDEIPGFDEAFYSPAQYYEQGNEWKEVSLEQVSESILSKCEGLKLVPPESCAVDLKEVAAEVHRRWPGRWEGPFTLGTRGPRFWDPESDNPTSSIIHETGVYCFTGERRFLSYGELLGDEFDSNRLAMVNTLKKAPEIHFDGQYYWVRDVGGCFRSTSREDVRMAAKKAWGVDPDWLLYSVQQLCRIEGAGPFVHQPYGFLEIDGMKYLNITNLKVMQPAKQEGEFPEIKKFYERFFGDELNRNYFFAWLKHFYSGASEQQPRPGVALFVVGGVNTGKTFQNYALLNKLVGGAVDATRFLLGEDSFNRQYLASPLWCIDDAQAIEDRSKMRTYSSNLKRMIANRRHTSSEKYQVNCQTIWMGRIIVTLNPDPESIQLLPPLDQSNADKVMFLKATDRTMEVPSSEYIETLHKELPFFARWLLDWVPPECVNYGGRFGHKAYHHPDLLEESRHSSDTAQFEELLFLFASKACKDQPKWEGTATDLVTKLSAVPGMESVTRKLSAVGVGRTLRKLGDRKWLEILPKGKSRQYRIHLDILREDKEAA